MEQQLVPRNQNLGRSWAIGSERVLGAVFVFVLLYLFVPDSQTDESVL